MLHSLSKILHFTPFSEKKGSFLFSHRHKVRVRGRRRNKNMQYICNKNKNDWGQSSSNDGSQRTFQKSNMENYP